MIFVTKGAYIRLQKKHLEYLEKYGEQQQQLIDALQALIDERDRYTKLLEQWNEMVERINAKGGAQFLNSTPTKVFTKEEIKLLIKLCHPDKHGNSEEANRITSKLLRLR